jgi:hypothetical protein
VLHHIPDITPIIRALHDKLKPSGELILMVYNKSSLLYAYSIMFLHEESGLSEDERVARYSERIEGCPYTKAYTREQVRELLSPLFEDAQLTVHFDVIDTPSKRKVKLQVPDGCDLGWHILAKARKGGKYLAAAAPNP